MTQQISTKSKSTEIESGPRAETTVPRAVQAPAPPSKTHLEIETCPAPACQKLPTEMTDAERKLLRRQRFLSSDTTTTLSAAKEKMLEEKQKRLQRAQRFGVSLPELEKKKREERAKRFGVE